MNLLSVSFGQFCYIMYNYLLSVKYHHFFSHSALVLVCTSCGTKFFKQIKDAYFQFVVLHYRVGIDCTLEFRYVFSLFILPSLTLEYVHLR